MNMNIEIEKRRNERTSKNNEVDKKRVFMTNFNFNLQSLQNMVYVHFCKYRKET